MKDQITGTKTEENIERKKRRKRTFFVYNNYVDLE